MSLLISSALYLGAKEAYSFYLSQGENASKEVQKELKQDFQNAKVGKVKVLQSSKIANLGFYHGLFSGKGIILPNKLPSNTNERKFAILQNLIYLKYSQLDSNVSKVIGRVAIVVVTYFISMAVFSALLPTALAKVTAGVAGFFMKETFIYFSTMKKLDKKLEKALPSDVFKAGLSYLKGKLDERKAYRNEKKITSVQSQWRAILIDKKGNYRFNTLAGVSLSDRIKKIRTI